MATEPHPLAGVNLSGRLSALYDSELLDTPSEPIFDRITTLISRLLQVPVALISLVDENRQFFKSQCGLPDAAADRRETPLTHSFCQHVVMSEQTFKVTDARTHPTVRQNGAVADLGVIAYLGVPLVTREGYVLGSLCAIDSKPHTWQEGDTRMLNDLAAQVIDIIELRTRNKRLTAQITELQTAASDRQFAATTAVHDLRTPLNSLMMGLSALPMLGQLNDTQQEYLAIAERNGSNLADMIDQLLNTFNIERRGKAALIPESCQPASMAHQAVDQVIALARHRQVTINVQVGEELPEFIGDEPMLVRVLVNLLGNALKFTPEKGQISLIVTIQPHAAQTNLVFSVTDNGVGIPANAREQVFQDGSQIDNHAQAVRSTGLGLTFCKRVVESHGGRIWFDSKPDKGSTFYFSLPVRVTATA